MTKFSFNNAEELLGGILEVANILNFEIDDAAPDFYVTAKKASDKKILNVTLKENCQSVVIDFILTFSKRKKIDFFILRLNDRV